MYEKECQEANTLQRIWTNITEERIQELGDSYKGKRGASKLFIFREEDKIGYFFSHSQLDHFY